MHKPVKPVIDIVVLECSAQLAADAAAFLEIVFGVAIRGEHDERRGVERVLCVSHFTTSSVGKFQSYAVFGEIKEKSMLSNTARLFENENSSNDSSE